MQMQFGACTHHHIHRSVDSIVRRHPLDRARSIIAYVRAVPLPGNLEEGVLRACSTTTVTLRACVRMERLRGNTMYHVPCLHLHSIHVYIRTHTQAGQLLRRAVKSSEIETVTNKMTCVVICLTNGTHVRRRPVHVNSRRRARESLVMHHEIKSLFLAWIFFFSFLLFPSGCAAAQVSLHTAVL